MTGVTTPGDESRTELAWQEIVENYGERAALPSDQSSQDPAADPSPAALEHPAPEPEDEPEEPVDEIAVVDRFQPPAAPPIPLPRTWERGAAWGGIFIAPALALLIALLGLHPPSIVGWSLVTWLVGGFAYLVYDMPRSPREPWDDGSRI